MRYTGCLAVSLLILLTVTPCLFGQDIFEAEKGLYSTGDLRASLESGTRDKIVIKSASSLEGTLLLKVAEGNTISLEYRKRARTDARSTAVDYIDLITVSLMAAPEHVRLELRAPNPAPWDNDVEAGSVDAVLTLPVGFAVEINAEKFDVDARGPLRSLVVPSSLGRFEVTDITETLDISTRNRRVSLDRISGQISAETSNSTLTATNLRAARETAMFRNDGGDIQIDGFVGEINVKNRFGRIVIEKFVPNGKSNFIRGSYGPISLDLLEMPSGQLVISNQHEDINISIPDTLSAYLSLSVDEDGVIEAVNFPFIADLVERDRLSLVVGGGKVEIVGSVRGKGNIYVRGIEGE